MNAEALCNRTCISNYFSTQYGACALEKDHEGSCMTAGQIVAARPFPRINWPQPSLVGVDMRDGYEMMPVRVSIFVNLSSFDLDSVFLSIR